MAGPSAADPRLTLTLRSGALGGGREGAARTADEADQAEKAIAQVRESVGELPADKLPAEKVSELSRLLPEGTWTHDHPITFDKATSFGLPIRRDIPAEFVEPMTLYPQPVHRQPSVEYVPEPRRFRDAGNRGSAEVSRY